MGIEAYAEEAYKFLKQVDLEILTEDCVIDCIGRHGLHTLLDLKFLEPFKRVNGRQLYKLCCEGGS